MAFKQILCLFLLANSCLVFSQEPEISKKHIKIRSAVSSGWSPGIVKENSQPAGGLLYQIELKVKRSGDFKFEGLITSGEKLTIGLVKDNERNPSGPFSKRTKLQIVSRSNRASPSAQEDTTIHKLIAGQPDVSAWVQYSFEGKSFLVPVRQIDTKKNEKLIP
jgi:hypothetical protein